MSKVKVKTDFSKLQRKFDKLQGKALNALAKKYEQAIRLEISQGRSPVDGQGRFDGYSESYRQAIETGRYAREGKRIRPVNLYLSGEMMRSLKSTVFRNKIWIRFDNYLADIHNRKGAGKSRTKRRLLPTRNGESFNQSIQADIRKVLRNIVKQIMS
jgi:hypothetical protein